MYPQFFKIRFSRFLAVFSLFVLAVMFSASPAGAVTINEFPLPNFDSQPMSITAGPDGNLWFTEVTPTVDEGLAAKIGRITPAGVIAEFPISGYPEGITAGPDGNLWFTEVTPTADGGSAAKIGRITPDGSITEFPVSGYPEGITAGPDGNLWFPDMAGKIGKITPSGVITEFPVSTLYGFPEGITAGPDGNLWFTEANTGEIGRVTTAGIVTQFLVSTPNGFFESFAEQITAGPDGNLWFTEANAAKIGKITTDGIVTEFPVLAGSIPFDITAGPDGNLWFTEANAAKIGRITTDGTVTEFPVPGASAAPGGITAGADGNLWFTEAGEIGQVIPDKNPIVTPAPAPATTFTTVYADPICSTDYFTDMTSKNTDPAQAVPLWVWEEILTPVAESAAAPDTANPPGLVHISLNLGDYANPVDVYVGIEIPSFSTDIYMFDQNGGLRSLSTEGLVKYKSAVTSMKGDILTLTIDQMSQLKAAYPDPWRFYVLVVPAGNIDNGIVSSYYLWEMTY